MALILMQRASVTDLFKYENNTGVMVSIQEDSEGKIDSICSNQLCAT